MFERRMKRSAERLEALQYLVETVADRGTLQALVLADDCGRIVAGMGPRSDLRSLAKTAGQLATGSFTGADVASVGGHFDVTARSIATKDGPFYFGAIGDRVAGIGDAVRAVQRIVLQTPGT
jgi:hypothetical protein